MTKRRMAEWPVETLFVVYWAGPHCNGANKAAVRLEWLARAGDTAMRRRVLLLMETPVLLP
jgi:hypothetical protein